MLHGMMLGLMNCKKCTLRFAFRSNLSGGISLVASGILYLRVHQSIRDVMFMT